ncbi:TolC family protein [Mucilaginibacter sp. HMF5004]|uniref:TolC family protein n=1 Tax=Mucilaginibacter rivuli TaxID=2857527 RepID=UPI001C5FCBBE|nr:TolC family protein [Mucilaginibacter rivuli]MBW4888928.1 TolC family protein [Mucilaginibacter rivuli]
MILKKYIFFCVICLLTMSQARVQAQKLYTLTECKEIALKQNLQLKADTLDLEKTNASIRQAYSSLLPNVNINGAYQYSPQVQANIIPAETFGGAAGTYTAARLGVAQTKYATAELTQSLFNPSAVIALKAAKILVIGNQLQIQSSKEDLIYNVAATYYNIQSLLEKEKLTKSSLQNTETLLQNTTEQFKAGLVTQTDVERLTVNRDNTKANLQGVQNNKEKYYNLLKVLMNMPLEPAISIDTLNDKETVTIPVTDYDPRLKINYLQVMQNKKIAELEYKNIKSGYLPTISLFANYSEYGYNSDANPFKNINGQFYPTSTLGIRFKIPIFDGFNIKYKAIQKKIDISKLDIQARQTLQQNERDAADASADIRSNRITYDNQRRSLALAQKVLTDINQQYQSGLVKMSDVINATSDLQTAQNNYVTAFINLKQAEINLKKAQGTLLP